jgi:hypothetical protein
VRGWFEDGKEEMDWLVFDFGRNYGDNFRGFLFLKGLKEKFPQVRMTCWITPDLHAHLQGLLKYLRFMDTFLMRERTPRETYQINFEIIKKVLQGKKDVRLENFPGGYGPDGKYYQKIIPNSEPWMTAKMISGASLEAPDVANQGEFLSAMLGLSPDEVAQGSPLFGRRDTAEDYICVGLCRPSREDRKQPSKPKIGKIWERILKWNQRVFVLDFQDWYPIPASERIEDWRKRSWEDKVSILNRAQLFIGVDGGLNHFAAACGCPTLSFYGENKSYDQGEKFGPYPRQTPLGVHTTFVNFDRFLKGIDQRLEELSDG